MEKVRFSVFKRSNGLLTKQMSLNAEGQLVKDSTACALDIGQCRQASVDSFEELDGVLGNLTIHQAVAYGIGSINDVTIVSKNKQEKECLTIGIQLQEYLNQWWQQHLKDEYQLDSHLEIEFETHYLRFLMPTIRGAKKGSKKRYAGMINKNGKHQMVFKGLETVRTDWTPLAREFQQELYQRIFNNQPFVDFIKTTHDALFNGQLDDKLTYTKRLRRPLETYTRTQPPQVKAAKKMKNPGRKIHYIITLNGPEPTENLQSTPDYQHYSDKQLAPVADSILHFLDTSFEKITARQLDVFG